MVGRLNWCQSWLTRYCMTLGSVSIIRPERCVGIGPAVAHRHRLALGRPRLGGLPNPVGAPPPPEARVDVNSAATMDAPPVVGHLTPVDMLLSSVLSL